jgi:competence protein ComEC
VALSLHALLALLRCPRPAASLIVLAVLWLDVDTTGASPSAVRAFLMIAALESSRLFRLPGNSLAALSAAALLVVLFDPAAFARASFRMSYGVVLAILTFGLPLADRLKTAIDGPFPRRTGRLLSALRRHLPGALGVGIAAGLVGAVTGIEYFHVFTPGGLIANLVLAPLAALVLVAGFCSLSLGLAGWAAASVFFNGAAAVLLGAIERLIRLELRLPGVFATARFRAPWIGPASEAVLIAACIAGYALRWGPARSRWSPLFAAAAAPLGIVVLALVFGVRFGDSASHP